MIAVTGANGLLGSFIVRQLLAMQQPVVAIKRKDSDTSLLADVHNRITWRDADVLDEVALHDALENTTHVIHAAALVTFNPRRARQLMDVNVRGTRNVVNACIAANTRRLVHISSVAALGRQKGQTLIDETNKWANSPLNNAYGESKYFAELEVFRGIEEGLHAAIINPSVILAPADWNKSSGQFFKYSWNEKPFYTDGYLNYVDVRDVAHIACALLEHPAWGQRYIVSAGNISYKDFFDQIAAHFGKKAPSVKLGRTALRVASWVESVRSRVMHTEPLVTPERVHLAGMEFLYSNEKIRKMLGCEFQPIEQSLKWCCQYYRAAMEGKK